ncbi:MAG: monofunctional biosynthetic peptidoglycan transglycosylase [Bacteroidia bacterium]
MKNTSLVSKFLKTIWRFGLFFVFFSFVLVLVFRWFPVPLTPLMLIRTIENKDTGIEHSWVPLGEIANSMQLAVVCTEDQNFLHHPGIDTAAIQRALDEAEDGKRVRGGSTITQQTAKNVFLWPSSTYVRKGFELWFTLLIEICWSKERIMEVYLNSIEFGDGIYGVEAASHKYFGKPAKQLTKEQSALLAIVLPNPIRFKVNAPTPYMRRRQSWALLQMAAWGGKLDYDYDPTLNLPNPKKRRRSAK